jgi:hypothetical protein
MRRPARVVVMGADAAGMSAAHQALRDAQARGRELGIVVLESSRHTSYSACTEMWRLMTHHCLEDHGRVGGRLPVRRWAGYRAVWE